VPAFTESLPISDQDRDFVRVQKLGANESVGELGKSPLDIISKKTKKFQVDPKMADVKQWFRCYEPSLNTMLDHVVHVHDEDTESWSVCSVSTADSTQSGGPSRSLRADSITSMTSDSNETRFILLDPIVEETREGLRSANSDGRLSAANLAALVEQLTTTP